MFLLRRSLSLEMHDRRQQVDAIGFTGGKVSNSTGGLEGSEKERKKKKGAGAH